MFHITFVVSSFLTFRRTEFILNFVFLGILGLYFIGAKGGSCENGSMITDRIECKDACSALDMAMGTLKNNKACYKAGNGKCRQDGRYKIRQGSKLSPICKNIGIMDFS